MFGIKIGKHNYIIFIVIIFTAFLYLKIVHAYFQQDEWTAFAIYLTRYTDPIKSLIFFFRPNVSHYVPLSDSLYLLVVDVFGFNYSGYAIVSIALHLICTYLVYLVGIKIFKNKYLAIVAATFFALNDSGQQATSWMAATFNTNGAVIFALLSIIFFYEFLETSAIKKQRTFFISLFFLVISILFKEISIGIFIYYFFVLLFFRGKITLKEKKKYLTLIFTTTFIYGIIRVLMVMLASRAYVEERVVTETQSIADIVGNFFTFPAKIFSQSMVPSNLLLSISKTFSSLLPSSITGIQRTTAFDIFTQNIMLQIINWIIFVSACFFAIKKRSRILLFGIFFVVINSFIYILSPGRNGSIPVVDSRNIYLPSIGAGIFVAGLFSVVKKGKTKLFIYFLVIFLLLINIIYLNKDLNVLVTEGQERSNVLSEIKRDYKVLPEKTIFYTESDTSYYGLPENEKIFPFQINFGYTILVYYLKENHYSWDFVKLGGYLYNIKAEGYKEENGIGFGYFRDIKLLTLALKENKLSLDAIIAYKYDSKSKKLMNITNEVRREASLILEK